MVDIFWCNYSYKKTKSNLNATACPANAGNAQTAPTFRGITVKELYNWLHPIG